MHDSAYYTIKTIFQGLGVEPGMNITSPFKAPDQNVQNDPLLYRSPFLLFQAFLACLAPLEDPVNREACHQRSFWKFLVCAL